MNTIQTSYFARYKKDNGISISRFTPDWFKGKSYKKLSPPETLLKQWKAGGLTEQEYEKIYREKVLNKLDANSVFKYIKGKTLLCYETADKFCHRHIVSKWLNEQLGIEVVEYMPKQYQKIVIGVDESYQETGIAIMADGKLLKEYGITFSDCNSKTAKRNYIANAIDSLVKTSKKKADEVEVIVERIRTFSAAGGGGFNLSTGYIKSTAALIASVADAAYRNGVYTYSVDTRSWKAQVLGSSKSSGGDNNKSKSKNKLTAIKHVLNKYGIDVSYRNAKGKLMYNDNRADAICIAEYGFLPKDRKKLKLED